MDICFPRREHLLTADVPGTVCTLGHLVFLEQPDPSDPTDDVDIWLTLPDDLHAPALARTAVAHGCRSLSGAVLDDLALLVSEVVTNAVEHGRPDVTLHLVLTLDVVGVEVFDHGAGLPDGAPVLSPPQRSSGRGLVIVDRVASRWGSRDSSGTRGKSVWFELDMPA